MAYQRRSLICILLGLVCAPFIHGQQEDAPVQFRLLTMSDVATLLYEVDGEETELYATSGAFSPYYNAPANGLIELYKKQPSPKAGQPDIKVNLAEIKLPEGPGPFMVVLREKENSGQLAYDWVAYDSSLDAHPPRSYRTINLSKRRMAVRLANQDSLIDPGETSIVDYPAERKVWLKVAVNSPEDGWIKVVSSPRMVDVNSRKTFLLVDLPPTDREAEPLGIVVREISEQIVEQDGVIEIR